MTTYKPGVRLRAVESFAALVPVFSCPISSFASDTGSIGSGMIAASALLCAVLFFSGRPPTKGMLGTATPFFLLVCAYAVSTLFGPTFNAVKHLVASVSVLFLLLYFVKHGRLLLDDKIFVYGVYLSLPLFVAPIAFSVSEKNFDAGMALYGIALSAFVAMRRTPAKSMFALLIVSISSAALCAIGLLVNFRMMVVYAIALLLLYIYFSRPNWISKHNTFSFIAYIALLGAFTLLYSNIEGFDYLYELNEFLVRYTDRTATSGRQLLWPTILEAIARHPVFGMGAGTLPSDIMYTELSSHNYYLQVTLQTGVIGLLFVLLSLRELWKGLLPNSNKDAKTAFSAAILIVFLLHNVSEVLMFQNGLRVSVAAWVLLFVAHSSIRPFRSQHGFN